MWPLVSAVQLHNDLKNFRRAMERKFGDVAGLWRLEWRTGLHDHPHFHLVLVEPHRMELSVIRSWAWETWSRIVGARSRVDIQFAEPRRVVAYIGKYMAKVDKRTGELCSREAPSSSSSIALSSSHNGAGGGVGCVWGVWGKKHLPWFEGVQIGFRIAEVGEKEFCEWLEFLTGVRRIARGYIEAQGRAKFGKKRKCWWLSRREYGWSVFMSPSSVTQILQYAGLEI